MSLEKIRSEIIGFKFYIFISQPQTILNEKGYILGLIIIFTYALRHFILKFPEQRFTNYDCENLSDFQKCVLNFIFCNIIMKINML